MTWPQWIGVWMLAVVAYALIDEFFGPRRGSHLFELWEWIGKKLLLPTVLTWIGLGLLLTFAVIGCTPALVQPPEPMAMLDVRADSTWAVESGVHHDLIPWAAAPSFTFTTTAPTLTSYPAVPAGRDPMDASQRPPGPASLTVTLTGRNWFGTVAPATALVRLWPAVAQGDSIAADRRVMDRAWWTVNWQDRAVDPYVWCAWPDSNGVAVFPRLPALPVYVGATVRMQYPEGDVWKPAVRRVELVPGGNMVNLEAW